MEKMEVFDLKAYWKALSKDERKDLAEAAGTTVLYIQTHLVRRTKIPGKDAMERLFRALSQRGALDRKELLLAFFYAR